MYIDLILFKAFFFFFLSGHGIFIFFYLLIEGDVSFSAGLAGTLSDRN